MGRIQSNLASRVKKGRMSEAAAQAAMARVKVGGQWRATLQRCSRVCLKPGGQHVASTHASQQRMGRS
jgi:hypothetical protein